MSDKRGFPMGHRHLEQTKAYYDKFFESDKGMKAEWNEQQHRTVTWYPALLLAVGRIAEVGCGAGHFAAMCKSFGLQYVYGMDISECAIRLAKDNAPGVRLDSADVGEIDLREKLVDVSAQTVVALEVLEHIWADKAIIRALPLGTTFVGSVPSFHTEGHVRWFASEDQVRARYSELLDIDTVIEERGVKSSNRWFIFRGKKK